MTRDIADLWRRLDAVASRTPKSLRLRPPVTERAIRAAEGAIGRPFPEDFRASLSVHDGQERSDDDDALFEWLPGHAPLAPLDAIVEEWRRECETFAQMIGPDERAEEIEGGRLHHFLWHPARIPIAGNAWWDQDNAYLDFFPGPRGTPGQLVVFGKGNFGSVSGPSFGAALELYVRVMESGEWLFRDGQCLPRAKGMNWWKLVKKKSPAPRKFGVVPGSRRPRVRALRSGRRPVRHRGARKAGGYVAAGARALSAGPRE